MLPADLSTRSAYWLRLAIAKRQARLRHLHADAADPIDVDVLTTLQEELQFLELVLQTRADSPERDGARVERIQGPSGPQDDISTVDGSDDRGDADDEDGADDRAASIGPLPEESRFSEDEGIDRDHADSDAMWPNLGVNLGTDFLNVNPRYGRPMQGNPSFRSGHATSPPRDDHLNVPRYGNGSPLAAEGSSAYAGQSNERNLTRTLPLPFHGSGVPRPPLYQYSHPSSSSSSPRPTPDLVSLHSSGDGTPPNLRKRLLSSPTAHRNERHSKMMRQSASPARARPDTPSSHGSLASFAEDIPESLLEILGGGEQARAQVRAMRQIEQEMEERRERERRDEEYARRLQEEFNQAGGSSITGPSIPSSSADPSRYQTFFNGDGSIRREDFPHHSRDAPLEGSTPRHTESLQWAPHSGSATSNSMPGQYPSLPVQDSSNLVQPSHRFNANRSEIAAPPISSSSNATRYPAPVVDLDTDYSEDDLPVVSLNPFTPLPPTRPGLGPSSQSWSNANQAWGRDTMVQRSRPLPLIPPASNHHTGAGGTSVYNGAQSTTGWMASLHDRITSAASMLAFPFNDIIDVDAIPEPRPDLDPFGLPTAGPSGAPWLDNTSSNMGYFDDRYDPKETAREIKELMNNIRPDEELGLSDRTGSPEDMAEGCGLYEHQKLGLGWMIQMEEGSNKGGILADDMGLGKTIQAIALMVSRRSEDKNCKTTVIVAPVALLKQWENEIRLKIRPEKRLSTYIYHGSKKKTTFNHLKTFDVVLTTYGTLGSELSRKLELELKARNNPQQTSDPNAFPLLGAQSKFYRIILDEAQNIKNKNTKAFRGASALQARTRFCMTGTPMMNNVGELYSLISFLRIRPYCDWRHFQSHIMQPLREHNSRICDNAMRKLQALLKAILLRRTKKSEINGKPILTLPERTTVVEHAVMEGDQLEFYQALENQTQIRFNRYLKAGTVGRNYHGVLLLLLRLRQACCHPHLIRNVAEQVAGTTDKTPDELEDIARRYLAPEVVNRLLEEGQVDCPICMDAVENSTIFTPCGHATCSECFVRFSDSSQAVDDGTDHRNNKFKCMNCRGPVDPTKVTDWKSFQKVYGPSEDGPSDVTEEAEVDSSDSESETDVESEDETDSLDGFIVNDNEQGEASDEDEEKPAVKDDDEASEPQRNAMPSLTELLDREASARSKENDDANSNDDAPQQLRKARKASSQQGKSKVSKKKSESRKKKGNKKGKGKGKEKLNIKLKNPTLAELQKESKRNLKAKQRYFAKLKEDFVSSAKIDKCIEILEQIAAKGTGEKTIVFSQFTTFLDLLEVPLTERHWAYKRYDGSMRAEARNEAVLEFTMRPRCRIMLVSLKAGNAGLNLTAANNVVILDPFWNPYIEEQAIDRVHRIGQRLPVVCHRILIEGTVEDRIMDIQERKRNIIEGALDENASKGIARLDARDLAFLFGVQS